ncbi:MAG: hypothetical protein LBN92_02995 [Treponema sp.]|nr:hypothetical protein [Treponema sp.]
MFETGDIKQCRTPLTESERDAAVRTVIRDARLGKKYFYELREACGVLRCTYDELLAMLALYRLDAVLFLSVYRVPWWDLCGYLLDNGDADLEDALNEYLEAIARRNSGGKSPENGNRPPAGRP